MTDGGWPQGTVTFLFTDVEGSTQRWRRDEAEMAAAMRNHDDVLNTVVVDAGGRLFKHTGDGIVAAFASPSSAVAAAAQAQDQLGLPVRMGLHTGEAESRDGDYFGTTLNRAARVMDAGHGGQILLSSATASLVSGVEMVDLGTYALKGLDEHERIHQVGAGSFAELRVPRRCARESSKRTRCVRRPRERHGGDRRTGRPEPHRHTDRRRGHRKDTVVVARGGVAAVAVPRWLLAGRPGGRQHSRCRTVCSGGWCRA